MGVAVTVLGSSGSYPAKGGACSGYLVQAGDHAVMLDAGPGTIANLQRHVGLDELDAVVLSHSHPDHWTDLMVLRTALKYGLEREGLVVFGTEDTLAMAQGIVRDELAPTIDWRVVTDEESTEVGPLSLSFSTTDHYVETLAVRVDHEDRSLAYSADTGPDWSFRELGEGIDLALCEATYASDDAAAGILHLSAGRAGMMSRESGVERLVLTHLLPGSDAALHRRAAEDTFGDEVQIAEIDERYEL